MDGQRFDELARLIATGVPRRRVLGMIAGGFAALGVRLSPTGATLVCLPEAMECEGSQIPCCVGLVCGGTGLLVCVPETTCIPEQEECGVTTEGLNGNGCCEGLVCVDGACEALEQACAGVGEGCGSSPVGCCEGLVCIDGTCDFPEPICAGVGEGCILPSGEANLGCCDGLICADGICSEPEPTCSAEGESCSIAAGSDDVCCDGLTCVDGICTVPSICTGEGLSCEADAECCAGICCGGACRDIECCIDDPNPNDRCGDGQTCFEGICQGVTEICESDDDCDDDTCCCEDGGCGDDCCEEEVTQLPGTGFGSGGSGKGSSKGWMAAAAGAAAAFVAGKKLKRDPKPAEPAE